MFFCLADWRETGGNQYHADTEPCGAYAFQRAGTERQTELLLRYQSGIEEHQYRESQKLINGNSFVFGVPGSGKSFFCKMEMGNVFLSGNDEIIVIDPMNEYFDITQTYGDTVVNMSTYTDNYVNPLDMDV